MLVDAHELHVLVRRNLGRDDRLGDQIKVFDVRQAGECVLKNGHDVRIAHVHERATCGTGRARNGHFVTVDVATLPCAHLHLEHVLAEARHIAERSQDLHAGAGAEMEWRAARLVGDALPLREQRDRTCAVAAHLGQRAVSVAVVHEPVRIARRAIGDLPFVHIGHRLRMRQTDQAVAADAEMAVAQESHFIGGRLVHTVFVEIHHEIVAGGVRFVNNAWNAHTSSLYTR